MKENNPGLFAALCLLTPFVLVGLIGLIVKIIRSSKVKSYRIIQRDKTSFSIQEKHLCFWMYYQEIGYESIERCNFSSFEDAKKSLDIIKQEREIGKFKKKVVYSSEERTFKKYDYIKE